MRQELVFPILINPVNNYDVRQSHMEAHPGVPFLLPYQNEIASCQEIGTARARIMKIVFSFVSYNTAVVPFYS